MISIVLINVDDLLVNYNIILYSCGTEVLRLTAPHVSAAVSQLD